MWKGAFKSITVCIVAVLFSLLFLYFGIQCYGLVSRPMLQKQAQQPVIIHISRQTSALSLMHALKIRGWVDSPRLLVFMTRVLGISTQLKAGIYEVHPGESVFHFLYRVVDGDVLQETFRIIEGTTKTQVSLALEHAPYLSYRVLDWQAIQGEHSSAEGLLLADTYHYDAGAESKTILQQAHAYLEQCLDAYWHSRAPNLPYKTSYELLIAASILEKEAADVHERHLIAGIIVNRLRKNMPLQMDPTVIYALGSAYSGTLSRADLHIDSPYNTYRYRGLPPTPIAMVSKDAIKAAAHPQITNYLYFVATGEGKHVFSENYEQQKNAVHRYVKTRKGL